ncbi:MAG: hypothetical protein GY787_28695 [Alteromonadales bacterium]|nr:hypothetical protein [Alteromonadales bacterium]
MKVTYLFLLLIVIFVTPFFAHSSVVKAAVLKDENFQKRYQEILNGRTPLEIDEFHPFSDGSHLEIIEMIILQQALYLGGLKDEVIFEPQEIANLGEISSIVDGSILMYGRSMWLQSSVDYQGSLYISEPVIKYGEFEAGLYYNASQNNILDIAPEDLSNFKVIANPRWLADWRALLNSPMVMVNFIGPWMHMIAMLDAGIADLMLINFSVSQDLNLVFKDNLYLPVNNFKVILPDSRHFVVSKVHPKGKEVFTALQKGLKIMRQKGKIRSLYEQAGVFNEKVSKWIVINKQMLVNP